MIFALVSPKTKNHNEDSNMSRDQEITLKEIGTLLSKARQDLNLSTKELADDLRIGEEQLVAVENGQENLLPEEVFIYAMIRRIAEKLQIETKTVTQLLEDLKASKHNKESRNKDQPIAAEKDRYNIKLFKNLERLYNKLLEKRVILLCIFTMIIGTSLTSFFNSKYNYKDFILGSNKDKKARELIPLGLLVIPKRPSKVAVVNSNGEVLFDGMLRNRIVIPPGNSVDIYAMKPELIFIQKAGQNPVPLDSGNFSYWYNITTDK